MAKANEKQTNQGNFWTAPEIKQLRELISQNTPTGLIAYKLQRTEDSIRKKAQREGLSLKPVNKSPYG
jgi:hypothetical protein